MLALPRRPRQLRAQHLRRVDLHHDLALEVAARVEAQIRVGGAGKAVVADHSVGDEIAGAGGYVVHRHIDPERLHGDHAEARVGLDCVTVDRALARDRGICRVKEAQPLWEAPEKAHVGDAILPRLLDDRLEAKMLQAAHGPTDDLPIGVGDPQDAPTTGALRVEDTCEKALAPFAAREDWPLDELRDAFDSRLGGGPYRHGLTKLTDSFLKDEFVSRNLDARQVAARPPQRLDVGQGEPEPIRALGAPWTSIVGVDPEVAVSADHAAEIASPIVGRVSRGVREPTGSHQLAVEREMWPAQWPTFGPRHMLPATRREKAMVVAGDEPCPIFERDPVGGLDARPLRERFGHDKAPVGALSHGAIDALANLQIRQSACTARPPSGSACRPIGSRRMHVRILDTDSPSSGTASARRRARG